MTSFKKPFIAIFMAMVFTIFALGATPANAVPQNHSYSENESDKDNNSIVKTQDIRIVTVEVRVVSVEVRTITVVSTETRFVNVVSIETRTVYVPVTNTVYVPVTNTVYVPVTNTVREEVIKYIQSPPNNIINNINISSDSRNDILSLQTVITNLQNTLDTNNKIDLYIINQLKLKYNNLAYKWNKTHKKNKIFLLK